MYKVFGFTFSGIRAAIIFIMLIAACIFVMRTAVRTSVRKHPEACLGAVQNHCISVIGKKWKAGMMSNEEYNKKYGLCKAVDIRLIEAAGGIFDPVTVRITVNADMGWPLDMNVFVFKALDMNFYTLTALRGIISGHWEFNHHQSYSNFTFNGSF